MLSESIIPIKEFNFSQIIQSSQNQTTSLNSSVFLTIGFRSVFARQVQVSSVLFQHVLTKTDRKVIGIFRQKPDRIRLQETRQNTIEQTNSETIDLDSQVIHSDQ